MTTAATLERFHIDSIIRLLAPAILDKTLDDLARDSFRLAGQHEARGEAFEVLYQCCIIACIRAVQEDIVGMGKWINKLQKNHIVFEDNLVARHVLALCEFLVDHSPAQIRCKALETHTLDLPDSDTETVTTAAAKFYIDEDDDLVDYSDDDEPGDDKPEEQPSDESSLYIAQYMASRGEECLRSKQYVEAQEMILNALEIIYGLGSIPTDLEDSLHHTLFSVRSRLHDLGDMRTILSRSESH